MLRLLHSHTLRLGAEECRRAYRASDLKSWIVGNLLMSEVANLEPDLPSLSMFILLKIISSQTLSCSTCWMQQFKHILL